MIDVEAIRAAMKASGLTVRTTLDGRAAEQTFATTAARDEYVDRARRLGAEVEIVAR